MNTTIVSQAFNLLERIHKLIEYCEPCAKLDAAQVIAVEQIDDTWVCKRCAHAIRYMKRQEQQEQNEL